MSYFTMKMHQIQFPDPAGGAYSALPDPLAEFKGARLLLREGREGEGKGGQGKGREGKGEGPPGSYLHPLT